MMMNNTSNLRVAKKRRTWLCANIGPGGMTAFPGGGARGIVRGNDRVPRTIPPPSGTRRGVEAEKEAAPEGLEQPEGHLRHCQKQTPMVLGHGNNAITIRY